MIGIDRILIPQKHEKLAANKFGEVTLVRLQLGVVPVDEDDEEVVRRTRARPLTP